MWLLYPQEIGTEKSRTLEERERERERDRVATSCLQHGYVTKSQYLLDLGPDETKRDHGIISI